EKKLIENTPTSKIRSIAMGPIEIYGKVLENENDLITTPFSKKRAAYCYWTIEEYKKQGKHSKWVKIKKGSLGKYFYVQDNTGTVLVDPNRANIDIPIDYETKNLNEKIKSSLKEMGIPHKGLIFNRSLRFREYYLIQNDKIYVMGYAGINPFVEGGTSQKNEKGIMIQKGSGKSFFYISDKPEKEILQDFGLKVYGEMYGGAALAIACLFIIFTYLKIL
ncbi:hypothetical protein HOD20_09920, partial [archaeon]|nr:hypothetical protein [archaeon]